MSRDGELRLSLIDGFGLIRDGRSISIASAPARALLSYLALCPGKRESRVRLAALFWEDQTEADGRRNLRQSLHVLKTALGDASDIIHSDKTEIGVDPACLVTDSEILIQKAEAGDVPAELTARALIHDGLLKALDARGETLGTWVILQRRDLEARLRSALEHTLAGGVAIVSQQAAHALLRLDAADEIATRYLMRRYFELGDTARALKIYAELWNHLEEHYDCEPSEDTMALVAELKAAEPGTPTSAAETAEGPAVGLRIGVRTSIQSKDDDDASFMLQAFHSELIAQLVKFRETEVVDLTLAAIAVDYALNMAIARSGGSYLVIATLSRVSNGVVIWSERLERLAENWWTLQAALASRIASSCNLSISRARLTEISKASTVQRAVDCWLLGQKCVRETTKESWLEAEDHFRMSIKLDPDFSMAYSSLSQLQNGLHLVRPGYFRSNDIHKESKALANRAVELDPADSRAHLHRAWAACLLGEYEQAASSFELARRCNANDPWTTMSSALGAAFASDYDLALSLTRRCFDEGWVTGRLYWGFQSNILFLSGDEEGCIAAAGNVRGSIVNFPAWEAAALWRLGRTDEAQARWAAFEADVRGRWDGDAPPTGERVLEWFLSLFPIRSAAAKSRLREGATGAAGQMH